MAYGSCKKCGNARAECECPGSPRARAEQRKEQADRLFQRMDTTQEEISRFIRQLRAGKL